MNQTMNRKKGSDFGRRNERDENGQDLRKKQNLNMYNHERLYETDENMTTTQKQGQKQGYRRWKVM